MTNKLVWERQRDGSWKSGRYTVWVQARPRDDLPWWGASLDYDKWFADGFLNKREAQRECQRHADGLIPDPPPRGSRR